MKTENYMKNANAQTIADTQRAASRTISDLDARVGRMNAAAINPQVSATPRGNDNATDEFISVPAGGGGGGGALPFTASLSGDEISILSGSYLEVNEVSSVGSLEATAGSYAYIQIKHSSTGVIDETTPFALVVSSVELDPIVLDTATSSFAQYSNCLLAAVVDGALQQYRSGNVTLITTTVNGKICLWPYFEGGSV